MTSPDRAPAFSFGEAIVLFLAGFVLSILAASAAVGVSSELVLLLGQIAWPVPAVAVALIRRGKLRVVGVASASGRTYAGGALVGSALWVVLIVAVMPLSEALFSADEFTAEMQALLSAMSPWTMLVLLAALPALCEELVFRGLLLRPLAARLGPWPAIIATSALFAVIHFDPVRFLPTGCLGIAFGYLTIRAGSIGPAVLAHFLNNAAVLMLSKYSPDSTLDNVYAVAALFVAASVAVWVGLQLARPPRD